MVDYDAKIKQLQAEAEAQREKREKYLNKAKEAEILEKKALDKIDSLKKEKIIEEKKSLDEKAQALGGCSAEEVLNLLAENPDLKALVMEISGSKAAENTKQEEPI